MTKNNTKQQKPQNKGKGHQSQQQKKKAAGPKKMSLPTYAMTILRPFQSKPSHIPDEKVGQSGLVYSRQYYRSTVQAAAGTGTSTTHTFGILLPPYPRFCWLEESSAGNGILTDLNSGGTLWLTPNATSGDILAPPNAASIYGSGGQTASARIRCVGIGVRVTYEGTELNRSGRYIVGMLRNSNPAFGVASTGTKLSLLSTAVDSVTATVTQIKQAMENPWETRISDGTLEAHWVPNGAPSYQAASYNSVDGTVFGTTAGAAVPISGWNAPVGGFGVESGQNTLCVIVDGDTTSTASATSNVYGIDIIWHWEAIPSDPTAVAYEVSASPANTMLLDKSLNMINSVPPARVITGQGGF